MTEACEMIAALERELKCQVKRTAGTCTAADCDNCRTRYLLTEAGRMLGTESEIDIPAHVVASEEIKRAEQLSQALRSVCTEVRLMRACDPNQCGTRACPYAHCEVGSAMKLLDKLELDTRREST